MAGNKNLNSAKTARKDEVYTQLTDIEKEMRYYRKHFKDKIVLCMDFEFVQRCKRIQLHRPGGHTDHDNQRGHVPWNA